jgi:serine/threonine-protein kinase
MGEVWRGVDVGWGGVERPVAVKVIAPELARLADFVKTFVDEARLSYLLSHSNVVHVRDIGQTEDGACFIAMEWVDGVDLGTLLKAVRATKQTVPLRFAVLIAVEVARGLDYAHRLRDDNGPVGLVHRDVSPANVLISYEGEVKISDFGIARSRLRETVSLPGAVKGKLGYMAPEQARTEEVDARVDVFSLGVVLYELVTGLNPYVLGGKPRPNDGSIVERVRKGVYPAPGEIAQVPSGLETILLRAMAPSRDGRYASCAALRDDLEAFARREGLVMSTSQLGAWVRGVVEAQAAMATAATEAATAVTDAAAATAPGRIVRREPATPPADVGKGFDAVLGAGLAALSGGDDDADAPEHAPASRTVALHPVIAAPNEEEPKAPAPSATTPSSRRTSEHDLIPARRSRWPIVVALALVAVGASVAFTTYALRDAPQASEPAPTTTTAATVPVPMPSTTPAVAVVRDGAARPRHESSDEPRARERRHAAALATLFVDTDVDAHVFVDGRFVDEAPARVALPPGRHTVRVEGTDQGLRLLPKEETVDLVSGESRRLQLDLR